MTALISGVPVGSSRSVRAERKEKEGGAATEAPSASGRLGALANQISILTVLLPAHYQNLICRHVFDRLSHVSAPAFRPASTAFLIGRRFAKRHADGRLTNGSPDATSKPGGRF